ncbi:16S rRNA (adenine(1518)-N(6)/adenine(1519)-N(6))-dimethyltransferase [Tissierella sp. P1]|jgi:16S rRNA (adenine1518-N6/adenine1519-N6)-dimethyltransferase|uniref:16S rRNA (adenine(1518)-N(6)/adenine(1519)-N(6))- dimethyltransferase RsmA n=1 Tax=Tissierella sp. P1 TaxID=1280483 RepID=UPI000BA0AC8F|nr:16S rRNA (adenine(1518)-N(6)/adenine(1519)-N(6))-dimethyltransferase RsmA [Tissierella sp. P1]MDU5081351.1 16S rRNA (adenine(1518)-N(6)/adenine(1519)-N(6))-dimethyltransferase RsmA [Bacillota bacterium]OZV12670.1 16S rRNA (adenine(1518)-N(6)/adenine(1519)-N(6))-dimethyltransferase [Tissierella sp. P1]
MEDKRLYSPKYVKEILERYGFKFSKSLGQNFLIDGNIVRKIVDEGDITSEDYIIEIGPGMGTLTEELALRAKKVVAIEIDDTLLPILDETLGKYDNVEVIHGDVLKIDIEKLIEENLSGGPVKVVANLPYYVTTPIIAKLIEDNLNLESIIVMVQKEVAERMEAGPGGKEYGSLSVFVNFYSKPEIVVKVPKTVFMPQPKIDSAVIKLEIKKELPDVDKDKFFKIVKAAFSKRRKTILNSLSTYGFNIEKETIKEALEKLNINVDTRAENLSVEDFIKISKTLPPLDI